MNPDEEKRSLSTPASRIPKPTAPTPNDQTTAIKSPPSAQDDIKETKPAAPGHLEQLAKDLQNCSWEELQARFTRAMDERSECESALQKETAELLEVSV
jgi:hypothetical protein